MLAEINREREAFPAAQQGSTSTELFTTIEGNYADAVRLLTTAHSVPFDGKATLFVAERTLQEGMSPERAGRRGLRSWISIVRIVRMWILSLGGVCKNWADYSRNAKQVN